MAILKNTTEVPHKTLSFTPLLTKAKTRELLIKKITAANPGSENLNWDVLQLITQDGETVNIDGKSHYAPAVRLAIADDQAENYAPVDIVFSFDTYPTIQQVIDAQGIESEYAWDQYDEVKHAIEALGYDVTEMVNLVPNGEPGPSESDSDTKYLLIYVERQQGDNGYGNGLVAWPLEALEAPAIAFKRVLSKQAIDTSSLKNTNLNISTPDEVLDK